MAFKRGDIVTITDMTSTNHPPFKGKIDFVTEEPITRGMSQYGFETNYFVKLDPSLYKSILLQGWQIYCYIAGQLKRCVITEITPSDKLLVEMYDPKMYTPLQHSFSINYDAIDSILIYQKGFTLTIG